MLADVGSSIRNSAQITKVSRRAKEAEKAEMTPKRAEESANPEDSPKEPLRRRPTSAEDSPKEDAGKNDQHCDICGRNNHDKTTCFYRPGGPGRPSGRAGGVSSGSWGPAPKEEDEDPDAETLNLMEFLHGDYAAPTSRKTGGGLGRTWHEGDDEEEERHHAPRRRNRANRYDAAPPSSEDESTENETSTTTPRTRARRTAPTGPRIPGFSMLSKFFIFLGIMMQGMPTSETLRLIQNSGFSDGTDLGRKDLEPNTVQYDVAETRESVSEVYREEDLVCGQCSEEEVDTKTVAPWTEPLTDEINEASRIALELYQDGYLTKEDLQSFDYCWNEQGCVSRQRGTTGWAFDTGASEDIVNVNDKSSVQRLTNTPGTATIEAIGQDVSVNDTATVKVPGLDGTRKALAVPHTPNCLSGGKVILQDGHSFIWTPSRGAWLIYGDRRGALQLDIVNNVPHMPPANRARKSQKLCDLGFTQQVRLLESMSDEALMTLQKEYNGMRAELREATRGMNATQIAEFRSSEAGLALREKILAGQKRPRRYVEIVDGKYIKHDVPDDEEGLPANAPTKTIRRLRRKLRDSKLRLEMSQTLSRLEGLPPPEHYLTHTPADPRCKTCVRSKQKRAAIRNLRGTEESLVKDVEDVLGLVGFDLIRCRIPDIHGRRWWITSRDKKAGYPRGMPLGDKEPSTTWRATRTMYPGTRLQPVQPTEGEAPLEPVQTFPRQVKIDGGTEWKAEWRENVEQRGAVVIDGPPGESTTNADTERWNQETEYQTAAAMDHANANPRMWSYAARVFYFNYARTFVDNAAKATPFRQMWKRDDTRELFPFGCEIAYVNDDADKFEGRSSTGVFMGYGPSESIDVMDYKRYEEDYTFRLVRTRNFQANRAVCPMRNLTHEENEDLDEFQFDPNSDDLGCTTYRDTNWVLRCSICDLVSTEAPVTCEHCLNNTRHGRGRPSTGCKYGRCKGHVLAEGQGPEAMPEDCAPVVAGGGVPMEVDSGDVAPAAAAAAALAPPVPPAPPAPFLPMPLDIGLMLGCGKSRGVFDPGGIARAMNDTAKRRDTSYLGRAAKAYAASEEEAERDHWACVSEMKHHFGLVTKVLNSSSREVMSDPQARASVLSEFDQLEKTHTIYPNNVEEKSAILAEHPDARFVDFLMLTSVKNVEDAARRKHKSRGVALGNRLRNKYGTVIKEHLVHAVPASMDMIRLGAGWALLTKSRGKRGDARGAYLQAPLSGPPVYIRIQDSILPDHWAKTNTYREPYRRVWSSMYGLQRGSCDWGRRAHGVIINDLNGTYVGDHGEGSLYTLAGRTAAEPPTLIILYAGDFDIVGPREAEAYDVVGPIVQFDHKSSDSASNLDEIIGMEMLDLGVDKNTGCQRSLMHQMNYCLHIVKSYEEKHNGGRPLKPPFTPMEAREERGSEEQEGLAEEADAAVHDWVPNLRDAKEKLGGELGWLSRGTRPDITVAQRKLSTRYHIWQRTDDRMMHRVFQYLKGTYVMGICSWGHPDDYHTFHLSLRTDSDHANDIVSAKSTSGGRLAIIGARGTYIPLSWWARRQGVTARNTGEAEAASLDEGSFQEALPMQGLLEDVTSRSVRILAEIDNSAACGAISRGFSRKLAYLEKWRRVSLSALHELYYGDNPERVGDDAYSYNRLSHRRGGKNDADLMTKAFAYPRHWTLCEMIGMRPVPWDTVIARLRTDVSKPSNKKV